MWRDKGSREETTVTHMVCIMVMNGPGPAALQVSRTTVGFSPRCFPRQPPAAIDGTAVAFASPSRNASTVIVVRNTGVAGVAIVPPQLKPTKLTNSLYTGGEKGAPASLNHGKMLVLS